MDKIAMWFGYGVMVVGGGFLVLYGFYLLWAGFCGAASGVIRSLRAFKASRNGGSHAGN